jgi:hypothetical protein
MGNLGAAVQGSFGSSRIGVSERTIDFINRFDGFFDNFLSLVHPYGDDLMHRLREGSLSPVCRFSQ